MSEGRCSPRLLLGNPNEGQAAARRRLATRQPGCSLHGRIGASARPLVPVRASSQRPKTKPAVNVPVRLRQRTKPEAQDGTVATSEPPETASRSSFQPVGATESSAAETGTAFDNSSFFDKKGVQDHCKDTCARREKSQQEDSEATLPQVFQDNAASEKAAFEKLKQEREAAFEKRMKELEAREANFRELMEQVQECLSCVMCFEQLCLPVSLNCGHAFCGSCISNYCQSLQYPILMKCPICRAQRVGQPSPALALDSICQILADKEQSARRVRQADANVSSTGQKFITRFDDAQSAAPSSRASSQEATPVDLIASLPIEAQLPARDALASSQESMLVDPAALPQSEAQLPGGDALAALQESIPADEELQNMVAMVLGLEQSALASTSGLTALMEEYAARHQIHQMLGISAEVDYSHQMSQEMLGIRENIYSDILAFMTPPRSPPRATGPAPNSPPLGEPPGGPPVARQTHPDGLNRGFVRSVVERLNRASD